MPPLDESRATAILDAVMRLAEPLSPETSVPATIPPPTRARRLLPTSLAIGVAMAAGLVLWVALRSGAPDSVPDIVPHRLELGGTARVLGPSDEAPRAYGPGDELLLRAIPQRPDAAVPEARLFAIPWSGGPRRVVSLPVTRATDGALELRGDIGQHLPAGRYIMLLQLGGASQCVLGGQGCFEAEVPIEVLSR